jgi:hypothetical protein
MRFLEYLFFKYYYFQVKVGNAIIAEYTAIILISMIIEFIYLDILSTYFFFFPSSKNYSGPGIQSIIILFILSIILLYFLLVHKHKYVKILENNKAKWKGKKTLGAVLFAVFPFVVFFFELYIKMLMNQGKL